MGAPSAYLEVAEAAWSWVLAQVRWDDGPWIPESVPVAGPSGPAEAGSPPEDRDGMHSGVGGLAYVLAEIAPHRPWTAEERELADGIVARLTARIPVEPSATFFDGLPSSIGALLALGAPGAEPAVGRLLDTATEDGWAQPYAVPPRYRPDARINDLTLGTAGVLLAALWARGHGVPRADDLADRAAAILLAEAEPRPAGLDWLFVPRRFKTDERAEMPNLSHGLAGVATALALAGAELGRADLLGAATRGAEHLLTLADTRGGGMTMTRSLPSAGDDDFVTYNWCHGAAGISLLFSALAHAGVEEVAGSPPARWRRACLRSVQTSGLPDRSTPGFWDNDGRCCGTAGVGEIVLDVGREERNGDDLAFVDRLGEALLERVVLVGPHAYWRFVEHRNTDPLLPPGVGWMQGAAGIAAFLFQLGRVDDPTGPTATVRRMDRWWVG